MVEKQFSYPLNNSTNRPSIFTERGVISVPIYGGYIQSREKNAEVREPKKWSTFQDIAVNVSVAATGVRYFLNLIASATWKFEPAIDAADGEELADFAESVMNDMHCSLPRMSRRVGMYRFHGFGIHEWVAKRRRDGRIGFEDVEARDPATICRWDVSENGDVKGVWQTSPQTGQEIYLPRWKLLYIVDDTFTDDPRGIGILRSLVEPAQRLRRYLDLEAKGYERDLRGIPVGKAPIAELNKRVKNGEMTAEQATGMVESLENFVRMQVKDQDTGIIIDTSPYTSIKEDGSVVSTQAQWGIELLTGQSTGLPDLGHAIERLNFEMARLLGIEHLLLGEGSTGSRALSEDKSRNFYLIVNSVLSEMKGEYKRNLLEPLWAINGLDPDTIPDIKVSEVSFRSVEEVGRTLRDLALAGATLMPTDPAIDDLRELVGLSRRKGDEIPPVPVEPSTMNVATPGKPREVNQGEGPQGEY